MRATDVRLAILSAALLLLPIAGAGGQTVCPEGRTLSGKCVKPDLAQSMRKSTILNTQPKLSYTSPPLLPSEESDYYTPRDFQELLSLFASGLLAPRSSGGARRP
jgi:hypothetical protein